MSIGAKRHRITFQTLTRTPDGMGGHTEAWADGDSVWASVTGLSATERIAAMQTQGEVTHRIVIRYRDDISSAWRVKDGDRVYDIDPPVDPDGRRRELHMTAREVAA